MIVGDPYLKLYQCLCKISFHVTAGENDERIYEPGKFSAIVVANSRAKARAIFRRRFQNNIYLDLGEIQVQHIPGFYGKTKEGVLSEDDPSWDLLT